MPAVTKVVKGKTRHLFVKHHDEAPSLPPFSPSWPGQELPHEPSPEQPAPSAHTDEPANEAPKEPARKVTAGAETAKSREEERTISSYVAKFLRAGKDGGGQEECGKPTSGTSEAAAGIAEPPKKLSTEIQQRTCICGPKTKILLLTVAGVTLVIIATAVVTAVKNSSPRDDPVISGHFGAVRGQRLVVSDQDRQWEVLAFLGVPFAKAPRGELRFKPPQPLATPVGKDQREDSASRTLDTWTKRPPCPQQDFYLGHQAVNTSNATEDCLHLNIWAPPSSCGTSEEQEACELRTVLFFLYGAAFQNGGNNFEARSHGNSTTGGLYDGRYLSALGNLVVVVPNYRVGPLGFLGSRVGTSFPQNLGLHDQRLALEWTRDNIDSFGGSASHLVLAGHDAGATSLGYHLFSGDTAFWTQNVDRFILQSGGPFHSYEGQNVEGARQLIASLRCPGDMSSEVTLGCLQRAHTDAIARSPIAPSFVPVFGREPLPRPQPLDARDKSIKATGLKGKQFLLGRVACEGAYPWFVEQRHTGTGDPQQIATLLLGHKEMRRWQNDSGVHRGRILLERWQNATGISLSLAPGRRTYQEAVGDILEVCPMSELAEQLYAWHNRVHVYELGYRPSYSSWLSENAAVHFEDMELVFGMPLRPGVVSSDLDKTWSRTMIHVWATFARTGQPPVVHNLRWPRYDSTLHTIMKLGPQHVTEQAETKRTRCNLMRDTSVPY
ncbi:acetylcholinesterase-like [Dermacentor andersoni]|uniref:acetylcholinesterase-like n=1 Tax=Dermacentor andersoni TaxID=34620 RepID=UPI0024180730|nr:acetylcholinesterase-like [Dermacentor andersoni]